SDHQCPAATHGFGRRFCPGPQATGDPPLFRGKGVRRVASPPLRWRRGHAGRGCVARVGCHALPTAESLRAPLEPPWHIGAMTGTATVQVGGLRVGYERTGDGSGWPVVLLHGFPYDVRSYDRVAAILAAAGADVVVPYLRGYGPTTFVDPATLRSGQQAALAHDLRSLIEALELPRPIVAGFDWGGRAACLTAA